MCSELVGRGCPQSKTPATVTSYLTEAVARDIIESGILPEGALQLICGSANELLDHVNYQDVVTFHRISKHGTFS